MTGAEARTYRPATLCEVCERACGRCCWSAFGVQQPVPGWDAVRRDILGTDTRGRTGPGAYVESYVVLYCPEFALEEKNRWAYERFRPEDVRREVSRRERTSDTMRRKKGEQNA